MRNCEESLRTSARQRPGPSVTQEAETLICRSDGSPLSIGGIPTASSGLGALHWLHSLRHEKFRLPQLLVGEHVKLFKRQKTQQKRLCRSLNPDSRVGALPVSGSLLTSSRSSPNSTSVASLETSPPTTASKTAAAATHGTCSP